MNSLTAGPWLVLLLVSAVGAESGATRDLKISPAEADRRMLEELPLGGRFQDVLSQRLDEVTDRSPLDSLDNASRRRMKTLAWGIIDRHDRSADHLRSNRAAESAYLTLFFDAAGDTTVGDSSLLKIVSGLADVATLNPHIVYGEGPILLANRTGFAAEAERIARAGLDAAAAYTSVRRPSETAAERAHRQDWLESGVRSALGWTIANQNRLDEAERQLRRAIELDPTGWRVFHHLGQIREAQGNAAEAESMYTRSLMLRRDGSNPSWASVQALYELRSGSREGSEAFTRSLLASADARRREVLLSQRLSDRRVPPFHLRTMDGDSVNSEELRGTVWVLNR